MNDRRSIAVIGGGLTGLAATHRLIELAEQDSWALEVTLFEAGPRCGGLFGTERIDGHLVETGADSFITSKPWALDLCLRLGLADHIIGTNPHYRRSLILHQGRPVPTPEGFELLVPRKLRALFASPLLSLSGKIDVAMEPFIPPRTDPSDESLADFVRRRMGREMLERIVQPMVGGIYTSDPEQLSMQATLSRFVLMEREHGSLLRAVRAVRQKEDGVGEELAGAEQGAIDVSGARYGLFVSLREGMSELLDALEAKVRSRATIETETPVVSVEQIDNGGYRVTPASRTDRIFDGVIVALPADRAATLIATLDSQLSQQLSRIPYASSAIVVSGHRFSDVTHPLDAFGLVIPHVENRKILAVSFLSRKFENRSPEGTVQLRTFVGGALQPEMLEQSDASLLAMVRQELHDILGVRGTPLFERVCRYERGMPQYHVGHLDIVAEIERRVAGHRAFALAGNAYHGVGIPDCIRSGESAAERVTRELLEQPASRENPGG